MAKKATQKDVFDRKLTPIITKLFDLCEQYAIPVSVVAKIEVEGENPKIFSDSLYPNGDNTDLFRIISLIARGALQIEDVDDGDYFLRNKEAIKPFLMQMFEEHAQTCDECKAELVRLIEVGEPVSDIDVVKKHFLRLPKIPFVMPFDGTIH